MRKLFWLSLIVSCSVDNPLPMSDALTVHEWGTFTSMLGSGGVMLEGLHHEEERLPAFVHSRSPGDPTGMKGLERTPTGVTQKLETPVLYFYSQRARQVKVHVEFPQGIVSQWYPDSAGFLPALGGLTNVAGGAMDWQAELKPGMGEGDFPAVAADDIWAPSRKVASMPLAIGGEHEQFIFYRGLGAFEVPFRVENDGTLTLHNDSPDVIPSIFLLRLTPAGGAIVELGSLDAKSALSNVVPPTPSAERETYVADAANRVAAALEKSGLHADEARAMVDTWSKSYFRSEGLRILYIVPRPWTDRLLPITISPQPESLVRTLVGRVEVLTPDDEATLSAQVRAAMNDKMATNDLIAQMGRFAEPKLRRIKELTLDESLQVYLGEAIAVAAALP